MPAMAGIQALPVQEYKSGQVRSARYSGSQQLLWASRPVHLGLKSVLLGAR